MDVHEKVEKMLRSGFNIHSIAMAVGWQETQVIEFRASLMDAEEKPKGRTQQDNMTKGELANAIRTKLGQPLKGLELATKACLVELLQKCN